MCPGQVPGSRSDKVSERSTTLAPENDAKSKPPPPPSCLKPPTNAGRRKPAVPEGAHGCLPYSIPLPYPPQRHLGGSQTASTPGMFASEFLEISFGVETQIFRVANHLGFGVSERLFDHVLRDVEVLQVQRVRDADEACFLGRDAPVAADGGAEGLLVAGQDHRYLGPLHERARDHVGVHSLTFDPVRKALRRQVGEPYPECVAVRLLADVADDDVLDGGRFRLLDAEDAESPYHVGVHPRP